MFRAKKKVLGYDHPDYTKSLGQLARLYHQMKQYEKAESYYIEAKKKNELEIGKEHPTYPNTVYSLAELYWETKQYENAESNYIEALQTSKLNIIRAQQHLSENEMLNYIQTFENNIDKLYSFAHQGDHSNKFAAFCYDNSLFYKGFLLNANHQMRQLITKNPRSNEKYQNLKALSSSLAKEYSKPIAQRDSATIADLEEKSNAIEKELILSLSGYDKVLRQVSSQDVQAQLQPGELAIEFVHYKLMNPNITDSTYYAAILLNHENQELDFVPLFEESALNKLIEVQNGRRADYVNNLYSSNERGFTVEDDQKSLYELIWEPLHKNIEGANKIYFSLSGILHRINLGAISIDDEKNILDDFNLVQLNSTRQLVIPHFGTSISQDALLYGGIEYEMDTVQMLIENEAFIASEDIDNTLDIAELSRGDSWGYLKYTQKEVESISAKLKEVKIQSKLETGLKASEDKFKQIGKDVASPRIIHLATHGYFFPDPKSKNNNESDNSVFSQSKNPMIRSGLLLAGSNHAWNGNGTLSNLQDGILTAFEISQLNLASTELVILSACETGLGQIEGNEGVYGLQRAFKIAGAKNLIMSLWQVPDRQTMEFMKHFYNSWLDEKVSIQDAFRATQIEMRNRFFDPYSWAGFVLVE